MRADGRPSWADDDAAQRAADVDLLRAHEPVIRYTRGELFFPTAVGPYVARCGLWRGATDGAAENLVPAGALTLERLAREGVAHQDLPLFLRLVQEPLGRTEYRAWRRTSRARLSGLGRFTTTGMFGRLVDAGFRASLLLRGKVAAGVAAAAEVAYREHLESARCTYYGRVVRDAGWVCLQFWFFYAMNDWRSTFGGVNDHEADWELVTVYLAEQPAGAPRPAWVACSSHDHSGDELRRRWDDPGLQREGEHPVVFAGAGSHSGAFVAGDDVISVDPPQLRGVLRVARRLQRLLAPWRDHAGVAAGFGIPFVDYARGDGVVVGPGHDAGWTPAVIDEDTPWVRDFPGLWGLDTYDRFGGERAPAGPRYERDGSVRASWADPLGWVGLRKVAPREDAVAELLVDRVAALDGELADLDRAIAADGAALRGLQVQARSLRAHEYARALAGDRAAEVHAREAALARTIDVRTRVAEERRAHLATLGAGLPPEPPLGLTARPRPSPLAEQERRTRFLRLWAVVSTPLLLAAVVVLLVGSPLTSAATVVVLVAAFAGVEAVARRRFLSFLASALLLTGAVGLGAAVLAVFWEHWRIAVSIPFGVAALALLVGNVRDVRHGWRRSRSSSWDGQRSSPGGPWSAP